MRVCVRVRACASVRVRLALQQQRAAGGPKVTERSTTNERLARRQEALQNLFSADDPNDSGGVFLSAEDAEQVRERQRSPVGFSKRETDRDRQTETQGRLGRRRFDSGGELASNAIGVAQIRRARRERAVGLAPPPVVEASVPADGAAKLTQRAKMLREQRQQVPLSERQTTNAEAAQRAALRREAYAQFTEGGGSFFMTDGAVPEELLEARRLAEQKENEAKERRRAVLATFSANDAHVFLHDHNIPQAMRGDDVLRERAESDPAPASPAGAPALSDRGAARQHLRRRLSSTASSNGSGGSSAGSVAERAKAMRMARQQRVGSERNQLPPGCEQLLPSILAATTICLAQLKLSPLYFALVA